MSPNEHAFAIPLAIALSVIVAMVVLAVVAATTGIGWTGKQAGARIDGAMVAEGGIRSISQSLKTRPEGSGDGFGLSPSELATFARDNHGELHAASRVCPGTGSFSIRVPADGGMSANWQIMDWIQPPPTHPTNATTVYVCGWRQRGDDAASASGLRVVRARMRPGTFADYQIVSNGVIRFEDLTTINGRVHSNGFLDGSVMPPPNLAALRVWTSPGSTVTCAASGAIYPTVSTAKGTIALSGSTSACRSHEYTGDFVDIGLARHTFDRMLANATGCASCARTFVDPSTPTIDVASAAAAAADPARQAQRAFYDVRLDTTSIRVGSPRAGGGWSTTTVPMPADGVTALLFNRDVYVRGNARGRVTIAATSNGEAGVQAPDIHIIGNLTTNVPALRAGGANSLGLVAEGSIRVNGPPNVPWSCITRIDAAMTAMSGGVTLPDHVRSTTVPVGGAAPRCASTLAINGSIASHAPATLRWEWGGGYWAGYQRRAYRWNSMLSRFPPPYYPVHSAWEVSEAATANADCFPTTSTGTVPRTAACM